MRFAGTREYYPDTEFVPLTGLLIGGAWIQPEIFCATGAFRLIVIGGAKDGEKTR